MARRIVLQEPESGLDVFLKELSRYASPQYQLSLREQERADARLELSKRQMDENERRYQDSLRQQKFRNDRAIASEEIANERFQFNKRNSEYAIARQNIDDAFAGMNPRQAANMNIDSLVIGIEDPNVNLRSRKYAESLINRGKQQFDRISSTLDIYNNQNPESPMTLDTALDVFRDDKSINKVFTDAYFSKGDLTDRERAQISTITPRLTSLRKQQADLLVQKASGVTGVDDALAEVIVNIDNLQGKLDSILQTSSTQRGDATIDPYSAMGASTTPLSDNLGLNPLIPEDTFASDDMYNVLFSDEEGIVDSAVDMANRNASGEDVKDVTLLQDKSVDEYDPTDESLDEESPIPPAFVETASDSTEGSDVLNTLLSGLGSAQAEETRKPKRKTRSRLLPLIDFTARLNRLDLFQEQLDKTPAKNRKKQESLNKKINKVKESIVKDFSKIYDSSEGDLSIDPRYTERTKLGVPMSRNELARLISLYNESGGDINEEGAISNFRNTMSSGLDNMLQGLGTTLELLQYKPPFR